ncbi:hypothetical protein ACLX1H_006031 [Fusarium chlamydosporum]
MVFPISVASHHHSYLQSNRNGFGSSILSWLGGFGHRNFEGYRIHSEKTVDIQDFPEACQSALTAVVRCDDYTADWTSPSYHGILPKEVDVESVCDKGCSQAISKWRSDVETYCGDLTWRNGAAAGVLGSFISQGINETCQTDKTGKYCNDIIYKFTLSETLDKMPHDELCSDCYVGRLRMMRDSPFSYYNRDSFYENALKQAIKRCDLSDQLTTPKDSPFPPETSDPIICLSNVTYTTKPGDTCDSLALKYSVSSAAIFIDNPDILDCNDMVEGVSICLPLQCQTYKLEKHDTCLSVAYATRLYIGDIPNLNTWVHQDCRNLQSATETLGRVICIAPPRYEYHGDTTSSEPSLFKYVEKAVPPPRYEYHADTTSSEPSLFKYVEKAVPPPNDGVLADKTTEACGKWYEVQEGDDCARVLLQTHISLSLFAFVNPSVSEGDCTADLVPGRTYCVGPTKEAIQSKIKSILTHWRHGCFAREADTEERSVLILEDMTHVKPMSIIACQVFCLQRGWNVWGIQNGDSCFCDNRLRMDSQIIDDSECNIHCNGNTTNVCGGKDAIEVFSDTELLRVEYKSLGCYVWDDEQSMQGILGGNTVRSDDKMGVDMCASHCTVGEKTEFFALREGNLCTCGMGMAKGAKKTSTDEY